MGSQGWHGTNKQTTGRVILVQPEALKMPK